jgi:hypothetical protein
MNILTMGAHPSGVELGCVGTLVATGLCLKANAIEGLAQCLAIQSRMSSSVQHLETFDVKLRLGRQFSLMKVPEPIDPAKSAPEREVEGECLWYKG